MKRAMINLAMRSLKHSIQVLVRHHHPMKDEKGFSLLEVVLSLALLGIIGVCFLGALGTASKVTLTADERQTATNLAETQMEYLKSQGYAANYEPAPIPDIYAGYSVEIETTSLQDSNIQKIIVIVGHQNKIPARLEGYKVR